MVDAIFTSLAQLRKTVFVGLFRLLRVLTQVAPFVFASGALALKGSTAINLFVRDVPRRSVDLDLALPDKPCLGGRRQPVQGSFGRSSRPHASSRPLDEVATACHASRQSEVPTRLAAKGMPQTAAPDKQLRTA